MSLDKAPHLKLSIVIPVYNEQETIGEVIDKVRSVDLGPIEKGIIVSDDGSTDNSAQVLEEYTRTMEELITVHTSPINLGKGAAVRLGMSYATGDIVIIQDADLELDPERVRADHRTDYGRACRRGLWLPLSWQPQRH